MCKQMAVFIILLLVLTGCGAGSYLDSEKQAAALLDAYETAIAAGNVDALDPILADMIRVSGVNISKHTYKQEVVADLGDLAEISNFEFADRRYTSSLNTVTVIADRQHTISDNDGETLSEKAVIFVIERKLPLMQWRIYQVN